MRTSHDGDLPQTGGRFRSLHPPCDDMGAVWIPRDRYCIETWWQTEEVSFPVSNLLQVKTSLVRKSQILAVGRDYCADDWGLLRIRRESPLLENGRTMQPTPDDQARRCGNKQKRQNSDDTPLGENGIGPSLGGDASTDRRRELRGASAR